MSGIMTGVYEPVLSYQFKVFLVPTATDKKNEKLIKDASDALGFSEIDMGGNETEVYEYQEGGENSFVHSFPSITKAGKLTLKHGLSSDSTVGMLRNMITHSEGKYEAGMFSMAIGMFSYPNSNPTFWYFTDVWITKMEVSGFNADKSSPVMIESLELVVKTAELEIAKSGGNKKKKEPKEEKPKPKPKKEKEKPKPKPEPKKEEEKPKPKPKKEKEKPEPKPKKEEEKPKKKKKKDDGWKERNRIRREKQAKKIEEAQKKKGNKNYKKNTYDGTLDNPAEKRKKKK